MDLKKSKVLRCPKKGKEWKDLQIITSARCPDKESLFLYFELPASHGDSCFRIDVNKEDLIKLLKHVANECPSVAETFAECVAVSARSYAAHVKSVGKNN